MWAAAFSIGSRVLTALGIIQASQMAEYFGATDKPEETLAGKVVKVVGALTLLLAVAAVAIYLLRRKK